MNENNSRKMGPRVTNHEKLQTTLSFLLFSFISTKHDFSNLKKNQRNLPIFLPLSVSLLFFTLFSFFKSQLLFSLLNFCQPFSLFLEAFYSHLNEVSRG